MSGSKTELILGKPKLSKRALNLESADLASNPSEALSANMIATRHVGLLKFKFKSVKLNAIKVPLLSQTNDVSWAHSSKRVGATVCTAHL